MILAVQMAWMTVRHEQMASLVYTQCPLLLSLSQISTFLGGDKIGVRTEFEPEPNLNVSSGSRFGKCQNLNWSSGSGFGEKASEPNWTERQVQVQGSENCWTWTQSSVHRSASSGGVRTSNLDSNLLPQFWVFLLCVLVFLCLKRELTLQQRRLTSSQL